jgi:hypothetical protein
MYNRFHHWRHHNSSFDPMRMQQDAFELLPEFEIPADDNAKQNTGKQPAGNPGARDAKNDTADPAAGWENDNESFAVRAAEFHLKNQYHLTDTIQKVINCATDPDFYIRRCDFITANKITGSVMWSPARKQVDITVCVKGKKLLCWYDYFVGLDGNLYLKNRKCSGKTKPCNT